MRPDLQWLKLNAGGDIRIERLLKVIAGRHGHRLASDVEAAKIALSDRERAEIAAAYAGLDTPIVIDRGKRDAAFRDDLARLTETAGQCIQEAGIHPDRLDAIMFTGGTSAMGTVRQSVQRAAPAAEPLDFDRMGAVGRGLALSAERVFGAGP